MVNQVLFGETFEVIEKEKEWSKIRLTFDNSEGFIDNKQYINITENFFSKLKSEKQYFSGEIIDFVTNDKNELTTIPLGSNLPFYNNGNLQITPEKNMFTKAQYYQSRNLKKKFCKLPLHI